MKSRSTPVTRGLCESQNQDHTIISEVRTAHVNQTHLLYHDIHQRLFSAYIITVSMTLPTFPSSYSNMFLFQVHDTVPFELLPYLDVQPPGPSAVPPTTQNRPVDGPEGDRTSPCHRSRFMLFWVRSRKRVSGHRASSCYLRYHTSNTRLRAALMCSGFIVYWICDVGEASGKRSSRRSGTDYR